MGRNRWYLKFTAIVCASLFLFGCGSDDPGTPPQEQLIEDPQPGTGPQPWYVSSEGGKDLGTSHLYTIDPVTYETVVVGPIRDSSAADIYITDLATSPGGVLFGCSSTHLYRINAQTAAATLVGPIGYNSVVSLDFNSAGYLYGATKTGGVLKIDPNPGRGYGELLFTLSDGYVSSGDLVFAPDGTLYASLSRPQENDAIAVIDLEAKTYTILGSGDSGARTIYGLSFYEEQLYGFTAGSRALLTIDVETGVATFVVGLPFRASGTN